MLEENFLYYREARQMPERMKQEALQLEPALGGYGVFIHFLWRSRLTTIL